MESVRIADGTEEEVGITSVKYRRQESAEM